MNEKKGREEILIYIQIQKLMLKMRHVMNKFVYLIKFILKSYEAWKSTSGHMEMLTHK